MSRTICNNFFKLSFNLKKTVAILGSEYKLNRTEEPFQELNKKSLGLKKILTKVPDEIADRKAFLETIRYFLSLFMYKFTFNKTFLAEFFC